MGQGRRAGRRVLPGRPRAADRGDGTLIERMFRFLALDRMRPRLHRWRLNLVTGAVRGSTDEDDGYLVTLTTDMNENRSECLVFDARRVGDGLVARIRLPERVSSGTHATWAAGASIPGWRTADTVGRALRTDG